MKKELVTINKMHEVLKSLQHKEKISPKYVVSLLKNLLNDKKNKGLWIKQEEDTKTKDSYLSVINKANDNEILAMRIESKKVCKSKKKPGMKKRRVERGDINV